MAAAHLGGCWLQRDCAQHNPISLVCATEAWSKKANNTHRSGHIDNAVIYVHCLAAFVQKDVEAELPQGPFLS